MKKGFSEDGKTAGLLVYRKMINGKRVIVSGYSEEECLAKMQVKEKANIDSVDLSIQEGMQRWLYTVKIKKIKPRSFDRLECTYKNQICNSEIAKKKPVDLTEEEANAFLDNVYQSKSLSTTKKTRDLLNGYMRYCKISFKTELPGTNDEKTLKVKQILPSEILDDQQIVAFKKVACSERGGRYGNLFYFLICTYLRIGEAQALKWSDINFQNKTIIINKAISTIVSRDNKGNRKADSKGRRNTIVISTVKSSKGNRTIFLTDEAIFALRNQQKINGDQELLFASEKGTLALETNLRRSLASILEKADIHIERFGLHRLRHTGISYCLRHGAPIDVVANQAGHDVRMTTQVYYHIIEAQKKAFADMMNSVNRAALEETVTEEEILEDALEDMK